MWNKYLSLLFILSSSLVYSQSSSQISSATISTPWWKSLGLKSASINISEKIDSNFIKLDKSVINIQESKLPNKITGPSAQTLGLDASTKLVFKPASRYIFINNTDFDFSATKIEGEGDYNETKGELSNNLLGLIIRGDHLFGHSLKLSHSQDFEYELNFDNNKIVQIDLTHNEYTGAIFYQYKLNNFYKTRLTASAQLLDYADDYSSYDVVRDQQNDQLNAKYRIDNIFSWKQFGFNIPFVYTQQYYKNRVALSENGDFLTADQYRPRDKLESTEVAPELSFETQLIRISGSLGLIDQYDRNFGARSFSGVKKTLALESHYENHSLKMDYSESDLKYDHALVSSFEHWRETSIIYGMNYSVSSLFIKNSVISFRIQKELARDNFYAAKFDSDIYQLALGMKY
ncbi:MAG: hypothetical protein H6620_06095 [Halobacteriovoraceae bacterium]|nr:hypothetical protein [Halobacteriovoraceae bacterium]